MTTYINAKAIDLLHDGRSVCVSSEETKKIFVPRGIPGETFQVEVTQTHPNFLEGKIKNFLETSPHRVVPSCPHYENCGGCQYQHISYEHQLYLKQKKAFETLQKIGKVTLPSYPPITRSKPLHYRNRLRLHLDFTKDKKHILGFFQEKTTQINVIKNCLLFIINLEDILKKIKNLLDEFFPQGNSGINQILIETTGKDPDKIFLHMEPFSHQKDFSDALRSISGLFLATSEDLLEEKYIETLFFLHPTSFSQVNQEITEKIIHSLCSFVKKEDIIYDLYCGIGTFSLPLAKKVSKVYGYESLSKSIELAKKNTKLNQLSEKTFFHLLNLEKKLPLLQENPSILLVDPPRKGLSSLLKKGLLQWKVPRIFYISCDMSTLARDINELKDTYEIKHFEIFDMFPQTSHFEVFCELSLR